MCCIYFKILLGYMFMQDVSEESRTKRLWLESSTEINDASVIGFLFD